ncbi:uncharacterized protein LOC119563094 isoform X2 [Drosophila subpulchrella]|uniref:uncharacterized protein LOC119563094 isoform X2 n=1 Tax=Drosophila subpulchrella TaxID=1486046 RepID=UPI0018A136C3|nr:uncharacterized protein LOC119563094 isoform X2 [Drosophila subpulchrella]
MLLSRISNGGWSWLCIESVNRSYKYVTLKVKLFKTPITKVKFRGILYKRFSGYRHFMFNVTVDACRFLNDTRTNPIVSYFLGFFKPFSNINHTCPFDKALTYWKPIGLLTISIGQW